MLYSVSRYEGKESILNHLEIHTKSFTDSLSSENKHFNYLEQYLNHENIQTIVYEFDYVDRDYIEDYSHYYSKCFEDYKKRCVRLHLFSSSFSKQEFEKILQGCRFPEKRKELQEYYFGFIVLRPIPGTIFGRTCLKPYPSSRPKDPTIKRFFPIVRSYTVNLFGIPLSVESIAFQEQDNSVSACATTALWSAFHGTGILFHHYIPSPFEITAIATALITDYANRSFPNTGLYPPQMAHAIKALRLDPALINCESTERFSAYTHAYLRARIPVIIGLNMIGLNMIGAKSNINNKKLGAHAVTAVGYNVDKKRTIVPFNNTTEDIPPLYLYSSLIDKVYVHDDQLGPFAKMTIQQGHLDTSWSELDFPRKYGKVIAEPTFLMIPLHPKIRISFEKILSIINAFRTTQLAYTTRIIVWDIHLATIDQLKNSFLTNDKLTDDNRLKLLTKSFPKYIWVADAHIKCGDAIDDSTLNFSFYFDATDIDNGKLFICAVHYKPEGYIMIREGATGLQSKSSQCFSIKNSHEYYSQQILHNYYLHDHSEDSKKEKTGLEQIKIYAPPQKEINEFRQDNQDLIGLG